jgi:hypothetical protein
VQRVRKFVEVGSGRIGYAMTEDILSEVSNGAKWNPDLSFSVADTLLGNPEFASVLKTVSRDGHVVIPLPPAGKARRRPSQFYGSNLMDHRGSYHCPSLEEQERFGVFFGIAGLSRRA